MDSTEGKHWHDFFFQKEERLHKRKKKKVEKFSGTMKFSQFLSTSTRLVGYWENSKHYFL